MRTCRMTSRSHVRYTCAAGHGVGYYLGMAYRGRIEV